LVAGGCPAIDTGATWIFPAFFALVALLYMADPFIRVWRRSGSFQVPQDPQFFAGLNILGGFFGAFCFFAIDAGLKLLLP
jgi:hypothetical protein